MKIVDFKATTVALPMEAPLRHSAAVHPGRCIRTILQVFTDEGIVGVGELEDVVHQHQLEILRLALVGRDPWDIEQLRILVIGTGHLLLQGQNLARNRLYAGLEIALMDLQAKALGMPLYKLLGGMLRDEIPMSAYLFYRYESETHPAVTTPEEMVAHARDLVDRYGFQTLKLKGGVFHPDQEIETIQRLREEFGPQCQLRLDPNNCWGLGTAIRAGHRLREFDLEYLEDPTWGIDGMAEVSRQTGIPLATNMCVVTFDQIPPAVAQRAVAVILSDPWYWGGPWGVKHLAVICQTFKIDGVVANDLVEALLLVPERTALGDAVGETLEAAHVSNAIGELLQAPRGGALLDLLENPDADLVVRERLARGRCGAIAEHVVEVVHRGHAVAELLVVLCRGQDVVGVEPAFWHPIGFMSGIPDSIGESVPDCSSRTIFPSLV